MPKRSHEEVLGAEYSAGNGIKQQRVAYKLSQGAKKVGHAFKVAKGFERQKLGRRRKNAVSENSTKDEERIDAEIAALKTLDTAVSAQQHLYKSLLKEKAIAEHSDLPEKVRAPFTKAKDGATLNVVARLCKSNQVRDAVTEVVQDVEKALGIHSEGLDKRKKRRLRAKDFGKDGEEGDNVVTKTATYVGDDPRDGADSSAESEDDILAQDLRIAGFDSSEEEDLAVSDLERQLETEGIARKATNATTGRYDFAADLSISGSDSEPASPSPEPQKVRPTTTKSSFIPSLTMGGYVSGSGSDLDDEIDVAPRKNRRGQRARQMIWEKKFGSKAKHLAKQNRNDGWDAKRGAVDGKERRRDGRQPRNEGPRRGAGADLRQPGLSKAGAEMKRAEPKQRKPRDDQGSIHPSWEAAKKAKEKKAVPVAFQGKKVTFD